MMQYDYARPAYYQPPYQQPQPQQPPQIRSGGIVSVPSEEAARNYPVAPGFTVTMRDETAPYLYEKTMGFSQLEPPVFRKARLLFEEGQPGEQPPAYADMAQLEALRDAVAGDIRALQKESAEIRALVAALIKTESNEPKRRKKEADDE